MITQERLKYLLQVCNQLTATAQELKELDSWYDSFEHDATLTSKLSDVEKNKLEQKILNNLNAKIDKPVYKLHWRHISIAAAIFFCLTAGVILYRASFQSAENPVVYAKHTNDIAPGKNVAVLTLSNGTHVNLNDKAGQIIAQEQQAEISIMADGTLKYAQSSINKNQQVYGDNVITVPRGGQYQVILPDGSKVWLNAASSLKYPTVFNGDKRMVELTGEAYFEVAHNKAKPFSVHSKGQVVNVLGTHFNIDSYDAEIVQTTLLQGSIQINQSASGLTKKLIPGQQASLTNSGIHIKEIDVENTIGWKNGVFTFENTDLKVVIDQLERWYDVDFIAAQIPDKKLYGRISRDVKLSSVLKMLQETSDVKFKIVGRRVILEN
jgi:transmembrane sensor